MSVYPIKQKNSLKGVKLFGKCYTQYCTHRLTIVAVVVVPVHIARIEVQVVSVVRVARIKRTTPVVAVRTRIIQTRIVAIARSWQENVQKIYENHLFRRQKELYD